MAQPNGPASLLADDWFVDPETSVPAPFAPTPSAITDDNDEDDWTSGQRHALTMALVAVAALVLLMPASVVVYNVLLEIFWCWSIASLLTYFFFVQGFVVALVCGGALCRRGEGAIRLTRAGQRLTVDRLRNNRRLLVDLEGRFQAVGLVRSLVFSSPLNAWGNSSPRTDLFLIDHDGQTVDVEESSDELQVEKNGEWLAFMLDLPVVDGRRGQVMPIPGESAEPEAGCTPLPPAPASSAPQVFEWDPGTLALYENPTESVKTAPMGWAGSLLLQAVLVLMALLAGWCLADTLLGHQVKSVAWGAGYLLAVAIFGAGRWFWSYLRRRDRQAVAVQLFGEPVDMQRLRFDAGLRRQLARRVKEIGVEPSMDRPVVYTLAERFDPRSTTSFLITRDGASCDLETGLNGAAVASRGRWLADALGVPLKDAVITDWTDFDW